MAYNGRRWVGKSATSASPPQKPEIPNGPRIAVVGTGIAAVMCTRSLAMLAQSDANDKPGLQNARITLCTSRGKLATQMGPKNQTVPQAGKPFFDYGCQYFTASDPCFRQEVEKWSAAGYLTALADGQVGTLSETDGFKPALGDKCWVGNGGMGPMLTKLIEGTAKEFAGTVDHVFGFPDANMAVKRMEKTSEGWHLGTQGGSSLGPFDIVVGCFAQHVLTDPFLASGGQACEKMLQCLRRVESNQLIPVQVYFDGEHLPASFTAAHVYGEDTLSFISNNSGKPQQNGQVGTPGPQHWTLISTASFAEREFNMNPKGYRKTAEKRLLEAFARILGVPDLSKHRPLVNRINHWEDGLPANTPPASRGCLFDADVGLGWCGDFCVMPGIQGAALSGQSMARTIADFLTSSNFDRQGLLPSDEQWVSFDPVDTTMVDIGAFSNKLGLMANWTHTNLVPSARDGYDQKAHTGAAGMGKAGGKSGSNNGKGAYKDYHHTQKGHSSHKGKVGHKGKGYRGKY